MIYLITYDLHKPGKDYTSLHNTIKTASTWWHYIESTWIIKTDLSVNEWSNRIRSVTDSNDNFLIVDISKQNRQGWLPKKAWDWIRENET
jgi:hypothetical protein